MASRRPKRPDGRLASGILHGWLGAFRCRRNIAALFVGGACSVLQRPCHAAEPPGAGGVADNWYLDARGNIRNADADYERLLDVGRPNHLRTTLELTLALGAGTLWYVADDRNVLDWDRPSAEERFNGGAWRLDTNTFPINFFWHPLSGSAFYALPRANRMGPWVSLGYGFATSMLWEYVIEFNEQVSINDVMVTPGAGLAFGEFFHKLAWYMNRTPGPATTGQSVARWLFGPTVTLHRTLDGEARWGVRDEHDMGQPDRLGFSDDLWHSFTTSYGFGGASNSARDSGAWAHRLSFEGELVSMPGFLRPGRITRAFHDVDFSSMAVELSATSEGPGLDVDADAILAGYLLQSLDGSVQRPRGTAVILGTSLGYRYLNSQSRGVDERLGVLHFPGLAADWHLLARSLRARFGFRAQPDFAGIGSIAYLDLPERRDPDRREKSTLREQGYYYAWGVSGALSGELALDGLRAGGRLRAGTYDSQEGLDRAQHRVRNDFDLTDTFVEYQASVGIAPPGSGLGLDLNYDHRRWHSRADDVESVTTTEMLTVGLAYSF